jgi:hypothetical protein
MQKFQLPYVILPNEFITLLKSNISVTTSPAPVFDVIRPNNAIYMSLEKAFDEFDDGRGLEKTMLALGWSNFRERMGSMYVYKAVHGNYPNKTNMDLVEDIRDLETKFVNHSVNGFSRVFLLGFYLRLANIKTQRRESNPYLEIKIPEEIVSFLRLSQGRSERLDWLILIVMHLQQGLGDKMLMNALISGKKFDDLYAVLSPELKRNMMDNLLAYGASIGEPDVFIYDKI